MEELLRLKPSPKESNKGYIKKMIAIRDILKKCCQLSLCISEGKHQRSPKPSSKGNINFLQKHLRREVSTFSKIISEGKCQLSPKPSAEGSINVLQNHLRREVPTFSKTISEGKYLNVLQNHRRREVSTLQCSLLRHRNHFGSRITNFQQRYSSVCQLYSCL